MGLCLITRSIFKKLILHQNTTVLPDSMETCFLVSIKSNCLVIILKLHVGYLRNNCLLTKRLEENFNIRITWNFHQWMAENCFYFVFSVTETSFHTLQTQDHTPFNKMYKWEKKVLSFQECLTNQVQIALGLCGSSNLLKCHSGLFLKCC